MAEYLRTRAKVLAAVLLVAATAAWGSTFVVMKHAVAGAPVAEFLAWRFVLATLLLVGLRPRSLTRLSRRGWAQGAGLGLVLAAGYLVQTYGLEHTSAAVSGFLTGLQVVFTPLLIWALLGRRPGRRTWLAIAVATSGLAVLTLRGASVGPGELLTIACAALFALQIVGVGRWVSPEEPYGLATVQLMVVAVVCLIVQAPAGMRLPGTGAEWEAVVITAVAATAFAFVVQSWAQAYLSATTASVIFTLEPVFSALWAWGGGERLGIPVVLGGALVVASMLVLGVGSRHTVPAEGGAAVPADPDGARSGSDPGLTELGAAGRSPAQTGSPVWITRRAMSSESTPPL